MQRSLAMKFFYCVLLLPGLVLADATIPIKDLPASKEPAALGRYEGSLIVESQAKSYDTLSMPLSALVAVGDDKTDSHNNSLYAAKQKLSLEGKLVRAAYILLAERSPLEVLRNYQQALKVKNGTILYECAGDEYGGDATAGADHGGGRTALIDSVYPINAVISANFSNGNCAINRGHVDQRFFVGKLDNAGVETHVAVLT
jgi:OOP family OmpA-OmpF porin